MDTVTINLRPSQPQTATLPRLVHYSENGPGSKALCGARIPQDALAAEDVEQPRRCTMCVLLLDRNRRLDR